MALHHWWQHGVRIRLRGNPGVHFSNAGGMLTERRSYLFNQDRSSSAIC